MKWLLENVNMLHSLWIYHITVQMIWICWELHKLLEWHLHQTIDFNYKNSVEGGLKGGKASFHKKVGIYNENWDWQKQHRQWCLQQQPLTVEEHQKQEAHFQAVLGWVPCEPWRCLYDSAVRLLLMCQVELCLFTKADHIYCGTLEGTVWLSWILMPALQWSRLVGKVLPGIIQIVIHQLDQPKYSCAHAQMLQMSRCCKVSINWFNWRLKNPVQMIGTGLAEGLLSLTKFGTDYIIAKQV